ncbi:CPBP family intramembrane glutamic endopeptidase [Gemmatirosa kalamazoonensis]|uniref:CPBP family intramembrane glutamic endopeptidase n=1 Tax=Gemmatirosa kalamazoonensis TaxID=861299 RepID=UPI0004BCAF65|nr:type II CAAX endopeptidase family protein [Gemmatirosa kalamazoonensis]
MLALVAGLLVAAQLVYPLLAAVLRALGIPLNAYWLSLADWLWVAGALAAHLFVLRLVERRPWADVGLGRAALRPRGLALGALLGAVAIGVPCLLLIVGRELRVLPSADGSWFGAAGSLLAKLAPAALLEELIFRGYPFMVLRESAGPVAALAATSVLFGIAHVSNPGVTVLSIVMVVLAGCFLGAVVLVTGSVWAAFATHLAWNWTLSAAVHAAVSGLPFAMPDYRTVDAGPDWLTGGAWGPEGGLAAGLGILSALALLRWRGASHFLERGRVAAGEHADG